MTTAIIALGAMFVTVIAAIIPNSEGRPWWIRPTHTPEATHAGAGQMAAAALQEQHPDEPPELLWQRLDTRDMSPDRVRGLKFGFFAYLHGA